MLKHGILGLLNYGDMTGYEIRETFQHSLNYFWPAQSSQIYRELHTLEDKNWIVSRKVEQTGKPDKNICHITEEGREELLRWLNEDGEINTRSSLLMRVFFLGERMDAENIEFFRQFAAACREHAQALSQPREAIRGYENAMQSPEKARYWKMTVEYGKKLLETNIAWAEECIRILEEDT